MKIAEFVNSRKGAAAVWFGLTVPVVVSAVGLSVDMGQTYLMRERLAQALDAAALAAAGTPTSSQEELEKKINDFIAANYPAGKVGFHTNVDVVESVDTLYVKAWAELNPAFMGVFGKDRIEVSVESEVTKEVKSLEVVLVMDVTGSMGTKKNGVTRLQNLQDAAHLFLDTMFRPSLNLDTLKIGLVPFSASVNISRYGLGRTLDNLPYGPNVMNNPQGIQWTTPGDNTSAGKRKWKGCVLEGPAPTDQQDHDGPWDMYRYCRNSSDQVVCDTGNANNDANIGCPKAPVTPMTNNKTELQLGINSLVAEGNTYINVGLVWGWRMISRLAPFEEGVSKRNEDWQKAIILMTDGVNEPHSQYSAYGRSSGSGITASVLNNRLLNVCDDLRDENILVYTITFESGVTAATKKLFQDCATTPAMAYNAPTGDELQHVYQKIARELSNMHLSK